MILSVSELGFDGSGNMLIGPEMVPITTSTSNSITQLIEDVFIGGGCFDVTNVQLIGSSQGVGSFANGAASVGFDEGVVLSSGAVNLVSGPNNQEGSGSSTGGGSDSDLQLLTAQGINDAAGIEFDFLQHYLRLIFVRLGSEEYCEYVNSNFNDVFGFFISGPGITDHFQTMELTLL